MRQIAIYGKGGLICNSRLVDNERELVEAFAKELNTQMLYFLPRDNVVQRSELQRKTVIQHDPSCAQADQYRALARVVEGNQRFTVPTPLTGEALEALLLRYCPAE